MERQARGVGEGNLCCSGTQGLCKNRVLRRVRRASQPIQTLVDPYPTQKSKEGNHIDLVWVLEQARTSQLD